MSMASTSLAAYHSVDLTELEQLVLDTVESYGITGCISDEVRARHPTLSYSSITARFASLEAEGQIFRAGDTRVGNSGRGQKVMRHIKYASSVPVIKASNKMNPYTKGFVKAVMLVKNALSLPDAKEALAKELRRMATK
jgi:hypothetical protein